MPFESCIFSVLIIEIEVIAFAANLTIVIIDLQ